MIEFITQLKIKNEVLYYFGWICSASSLFCIGMSFYSKVEVNQVSAWIKPFKFSFSTFLYAWAMAWFCYELKDFNTNLFNWSVVILLGFEIVYIAFQAARGQLSHFNVSTSFYSVMYSLMAFAASVVTIYSAYIGYLFCVQTFPQLPDYYVWSIRIGIFLFVIFAFEGFVMGSRLSHTIGGADGSEGLPLLHWSKTFGDPRVAHFIGMHALQFLPLISYYWIKDSKITIFVGVLYFILAFYTLIQALQGKPLIKSNENSISNAEIIQHKKIVTANVAIVYTLLMLWELFLGPYRDEFKIAYNYNLVPFKSIITFFNHYQQYEYKPFIINILGNIILFIPFGYWSPLFFRKLFSKIPVTLLFYFCLLFIIEYFQMIFKVGMFDVDDLILNCFGILLGNMFYQISVNYNLNETKP